jgi:hypothetical protein
MGHEDGIGLAMQWPRLEPMNKNSANPALSSAGRNKSFIQQWALDDDEQIFRNAD